MNFAPRDPERLNKWLVAGLVLAFVAFALFAVQQCFSGGM